MQKAFFYLLLISANVAAFFFIGMSFLFASNANGEGSPLETETQMFLSLSLYVFIISLVFSGIILLIGFLFRKKLNLNSTKLKKIFFFEMALFLVTYLSIYLYLSLRFSS